MTDKMTIRVDAEAGAPFVRNISGLENTDDSPEKYLELQYNEHRNPNYVRVTAKNHHAAKTISAFFYTLNDKGDPHIPGGTSGGTIKACLKPSEATVVHFEEKKHHPRLFLFNALFEDDD